MRFRHWLEALRRAVQASEVAPQPKPSRGLNWASRILLLSSSPCSTSSNAHLQLSEFLIFPVGRPFCLFVREILALIIYTPRFICCDQQRIAQLQSIERRAAIMLVYAGAHEADQAGFIHGHLAMEAR